MSTSGTEDSPQAPRRPPPWLAAVGLLVVIAVLLGGGLLLTRRPLKPPVPATQVAPPATQAPPVAAPTFAPAPPPAAAVVASTPTLAPAPPTATPQPAQPTATAPAAQPITTPVPAGPTATPAVLETLQAVSTQTIAMIHGTPAVIPTFGPSVTPQPGGGSEWWNQEAPVDPELAAQIEHAYNHFWDVRGVAMYTMDSSGLPDVMDGEPLRYLLEYMDSLRAQNKAVAIIVEHNARVLHASADEAAVEDEYINHSTDIDPVTKEPLETPPTESYVYDYRMRNVDGVWKVVESVRIDYE